MLPLQVVDPWVAENVMPVVQTAFCDDEEFTRMLRAFLWQFEAIELVADWPDDLKYFYDCLVTGPGVAINTPSIVSRVDPRLSSKDSVVAHNALHDARAIAEMARRL